MEVTCICMIFFMSLIPKASSQNIQIQVLPQPVIYQENDLVIQCSITNPPKSQLSSVFYIQLLRNSSTGFETVVSIVKDQTPQIQWPSGSSLQNRASAEGSEINTPSTAKLKLTIHKNSVLCPTDFTAYMCKLSGIRIFFPVTQETNPITITYIVKPRVIEMPRVRISGELTDTPLRRFPISTVIQLTCEGQIGNDARKTIRWCVRKSTDFTFTGLPQTPIHSEASLIGCQYTRSSTTTYILTDTDTSTQFLCESGDTGMCGTGSAIQYVYISTESNLSNTVEVSGENTRDSLQNTSDLVEDESGYRTITDESDRHQDTYDEITGSEEKNQYEAIPEKKYQGDCTHPYESLKKHDTAQHGIKKGNASNSHTSGISKKAEKSIFQPGFKEYVNASFTK
uniref:Uncharacterized protein LOC111125639 isoform X4 n=1 Tax=Crassostrea virginica TaxID=6565 RepID=A0A8B8DCF2_CRAVI|nr:uncharacterized protein LOC111125639 isoform X4 [Crassostrea virginica]